MATVLIAEDDEFLLQLLRVALSMEGFRVEVARDGAAALALARSGADAALLDIALPGTTGTDVLRALRGREDTRAVPVALMSGSEPAQTDIQAAQAFVRKPFTMAAVVATMRRLLQPAA
jgi:DNA-binding response OmpR family regulator